MIKNKLRVIVTGATGMVGEGVVHECLQNEAVETVLVITRNPTGTSHAKLKEIVHKDFFNLSTIANQLKGYNACFFCLGVTALGKSEDEYAKLTYTLTIGFAETLAKLNTDMTFCYVSGSGTDSSEKGKIMWARVKGRTENDLMKLPFKQVFNFRPAGIKTMLPVKPHQTYYTTYKYFSWIFSIVKLIAPNYVIDLKDIAQVMINVSLSGYSKNNIEVKDMKKIAKK